MTFLYPSILFGLLALSIPIIIHLFNFRKPKKIYFSNTRLLEDVQEVNRSKLKIKHWLILFSRLLFLTFLILAFAQPFIPAAQESKDESITFYLDNSFSMLNQVDESLNQEDVAISTLEAVTELFPLETDYRLITNQFSSLSGLPRSRAEVQDELTEVTLTPVRRSLDEIDQRISLQKRNGGGGLNFIVSDFQKSTVGDLSQVALDSQAYYYFIPVQGSVTSNVYIDSVFLASPFIKEGEANSIFVRLQNLGEYAVDDLVVKLFVNGSQVSSSGIEIPELGSAELEFELNFTLQPYNTCRLSFEEFPVSFDNDFFFVLNLTRQINVLEIKGDSATRVVEKVYGNPSLFRLETFTPGNLDYSALQRADLIVLNELDQISQVLQPYLSDFLKNGGSLLMIPSGQPDLPSYQQFFPSIYGFATGFAQTPMASPDKQDPFYQNIFEQSNQRFSMPQARKLLDWRATQRDVLKLRSGEPYLSALRFPGRVYLMGSPLRDGYTNFHKHALFVPVMYRLGVLSKASSEQLYYTTDQEVISVKVDSVLTNDIFKLRKDEEEVIPNQRVVGNTLVFELPQNTLSPGFYELMLNDQRRGVMAVNADKSESNLENYSKAELEALFAGLENVSVKESGDLNVLSASIKDEQFGVELWKYCLILALLFLIVEVLLIRFL